MSKNIIKVQPAPAPAEQEIKDQPTENTSNDEEDDSAKNVWEVFKKWMDMSTAHALPRIFKIEVTIPIKIFWTIVMLFCWAWAFYFIIIALIKFFSYPTNSNSANLSEMPTNFPAIDVCNVNPYDGNSAIFATVTETQASDDTPDSSDGSSYDGSSYDDDSSDRSVYWRAASTASTTYTNITSQNNLALIALENRAQNNASFNLAQYGYNITSMLLSCRFKGVTCSASDFTMYHNFYHGNCYRFNGDNGKGVLQSNKPGWRYGLQLELYTGDNGVYNTINGFRILIHNNSDTIVFPEDSGVPVAPGEMTELAISRLNTTILPAPYNDCIDDFTKSEYQYLVQQSTTIQQMKNVLKLSSYDQNICNKLCLQKYIYDTCKCTSFALPAYFTNQTGLGCNSQNETNCVPKAELEFYSGTGLTSCKAQCFDSCGSWTYKVKSYHANYPSQHYYNQISNPTLTKENYINYVAHVRIYYTEMSYDWSYQTPNCQIVDLFGIIGGQLGLFMGISMLSVCENFELIALYVVYFIKKSKKNKADKVKAKPA